MVSFMMVDLTAYQPNMGYLIHSKDLIIDIAICIFNFPLQQFF